MLYVGLDLSRKRLDWQALDREGQPTAIGAVAPEREGLAKLGQRLGDAPVLAVIESMSGARFVHDQLELAGCDVRIADAGKARGLAPLACKTDRIGLPSTKAIDTACVRTPLGAGDGEFKFLLEVCELRVLRRPVGIAFAIAPGAAASGEEVLTPRVIAANLTDPAIDYLPAGGEHFVWLTSEPGHRIQKLLVFMPGAGATNDPRLAAHRRRGGAPRLLHRVHRVAAFAGWSDARHGWVTLDNSVSTPAQKFFALINRRDGFFSRTCYAYQGLGLVSTCPWIGFDDATDTSNPLLVENDSPPYQGAHVLVTNVEPARFTGVSDPYHAGTTRDAWTPRAPDGTPLLLDACATSWATAATKAAHETLKRSPLWPPRRPHVRQRSCPSRCSSSSLSRSSGVSSAAETCTSFGSRKVHSVR